MFNFIMGHIYASVLLRLRDTLLKSFSIISPLLINFYFGIFSNYISKRIL